MVKSRRGYFKPKWTLTALTVVAVGLFLLLARWQVHRAEEKQSLLDMNERRRQASAMVLSGDEQLTRNRLRYRKVIVSGVWDSAHQILLDNRTRGGRVGYEVLTPLKIEDSRQTVLVNRGWVPLRRDRSQLPDVSLANEPVTVRGMADHFSKPGMSLEGMETPTEGWPAVVQHINPEIIAERLGQPILDFQIKMAPELPDGYLREWRLDHIRPHTSWGYAVQWAAFALIVLGLWIRHGLKRARDMQAEGSK
ncbi:SURF1 family protein [Methylohalobius crimeensis]|uniref:SURF1 family protein n=1 Tax=Methylohalobius crimeensis TaxID=244365 RepID=UPI0003B4DA57|nr:SURF1 family protein [Methylohalobius crimeensis]